MFKPLVTRFLQHLTEQNRWSRPHLQPFAGKTVTFEVGIVSAHLQILEDGSLCLAGETAGADARIQVPPSLAMRLMAKDESAKMLIKIEGDHELATALGKILPLMRWDVEEDLSQVIGDMPAHHLMSIGKKTSSSIEQQSINLAEMLSEYLQEERPSLAKKTQVLKFNSDVDALRNDVARAEKKLEKLSKMMPKTDEI